MKKWIAALATVGLLLSLLVVTPIVAGVSLFIGKKALASGLGSDGACLAGSVTSGGWANPVNGPLTSPFGSRSNPTGSGSEVHTGQDIAPPEGTPFFSASSGTVVAAYGNGDTNPAGDTGNGIIINAGDGVQIWYWHAQNGSTKVRRGDTVKAGQQLAVVGNTGRSTGAHLHFEVQVNGSPVEPIAFMKARGITLGADTTSGPTNDAPTRPTANQGITATLATGDSFTLTPKQYAVAETIIRAGQQKGVPSNGLIVSIMVALQESKLKMYANSNVPDSLGYPHDDVGSDHDSVNPLQQRPSSGWGTVAQLMDLNYAARAFFGGPSGPNHGEPKGLLDIPGHEQMSLGALSQRIQGSAFPDAYNKWEPVARKIVEQVTGSPSASCAPGSDLPNGAPVLAGSSSETRNKIIEYAKQGLGGSYVWGGTSFGAWDCSGYFLWVYTQAGVRGVPRTEQWTSAKKTTTPKPGDLVVQNPDGPNHWAHVGIYAGEGQMYSALNPSAGTLLHPVDWNPGSEYFTYFDD